jgi:hypothetical protein
MQAPAPIRQNPNASLAVGATPLTMLVAYGADRLGWKLEPWQAAGVAGGLLAATLWVGKAGARCAAFFAKRGLVGMARLIWRGDGS